MELSILEWIQSIHNPVLDRFMIAVTSLGNGGIFWIAVSVVLLIIPRTRKCGITVLTALILYQLFGNIILKNLIQRPRPFQLHDIGELLIPKPGEYSFPSGHAGASMAAAFVISDTYLLHKNGGRIGKGVGAAALLLALLIGFSRMYLFVHWPSDILVGILLGIFCAFLARLLVHAVTKKVRPIQ